MAETPTEVQPVVGMRFYQSRGAPQLYEVTHIGSGKVSYCPVYGQGHGTEQRCRVEVFGALVKSVVPDVR